MNTGKIIQTINTIYGGISPLIISPSGNSAIFGRGRDINIWDLNTKQCSRQLIGYWDLTSELGINFKHQLYDELIALGHYTKITALGVAPDGKYIVSGSQDGMVKVWDLTERGEQVGANMELIRECRLTIEGHTDEVTRIELISNGTQILTSSNDNTVRIWNLNTGICLQMLEEDERSVQEVVVPPDESHVVIGTAVDIRIRDLVTGEYLTILDQLDWNQLSNMVITPNGQYLFTVARDEHSDIVKGWDLRTYEPVFECWYAESSIAMLCALNNKEIVGLDKAHNPNIVVWKIKNE